MAFEHKPGSFTLFKNDKQGNDKRPDYTGTGVDLEGNKIKVSAWIKEGGKGKFMSCRYEPMQGRQERHTGGGNKGSVADIDSDIPFSSCALGDDVTFRKLRQDHE